MSQSKEMFNQMREEESLNLFLQPVESTFVMPIEDKHLLTADKAELSEIASRIVEAVDDGNADALNTLILAKKGFYVFESIVDAMKGKAELPEKGYSRHNVEMREQLTGVKYYYDGCNDPVWNEMNSRMVALKEEMKIREAWLKSLKGPVTERIDEVSGEVEEFETQVFPAAKVGGISLILTIK